MKKIYFVTLSFVLSFQLFSQNAVFPENGTIYDGSLHQILLTMTSEDATSLYSEAERWTDRKFSAKFTYDGTSTLENVGIRIKGNTSRNSYKQSIKIGTDEYIKQEFQGLKTFNLNGNHNDPSMIREVLSAYIMNKAGIVSIRANFVKYTLNTSYKGVFCNTEQINKKFISSRFGNDTGNLYKVSYPGDLSFIDLNQNSYKNLIQNNPLNERVYELKTNEKKDDYSDLVNLIDVINNSSETEFQTKLEEIFDVDAYLKVLAAEVLIGHWDNYSYNKNNYFLYHNPETQKFIYIPYDMDNTFGINWGFPTVATKDVNSWYNPNYTPVLTSKILSYTNYKKKYQQYIKEIIDVVFNENHLFPIIDSYKNLISSSIQIDPNFQGNIGYGFTFSSWNKSFTEKTFSHAPIGIKPYISARKSSALQQLDLLSAEEFILSNNKSIIYPNPATDKIHLPKNSISCEILNVNGSLISTPQLLDFSIDVSNLKQGIYLLKIKTSDEVLFEKLIKN